MTDPIAGLLRALAVQSPTAPALAFVVGVVTSAGPCVAPKIASVVGMSADATGRRRLAVGIFFACGLACAYALITVSASAFLRINAESRWIYLLLSGILVWQGIRAIVRTGIHDCSPPLRSGGSIRPSLCRALIAGASYAFVLSPCCTPFIASVAGIATSLRPLYAAAIAAAYGFGHAAPVLAGSLLASHAWESLAGRMRGPLAVIGGGTMLALGGYYAILA